MSKFVRVFSSCVAAAELAGRHIREVYESRVLKVVNKGGSVGSEYDPQTEADRLSQAIIYQMFKSKFGEVLLVCEEDVNTVDKVENEIVEGIVPDEFAEALLGRLALPNHSLNCGDLTVWVDPLDGTADFVNGLVEHVTVLIGFSVGGRPVAGIIHQPFFNYKDEKKNCGRTVWGVVGVGVYINNNKFVYKKKNNNFVVTTSKTHVDELLLKVVGSVKADEVLHSPGAGYKALMVLEGKADAFVYPSKGTCRWDICAAEAIFRAACGEGAFLRLTDMKGRRYEYEYKNRNTRNVCGVLATASGEEGFHAGIIESIPAELLQHFA